MQNAPAYTMQNYFADQRAAQQQREASANNQQVNALNQQKLQAGAQAQQDDASMRAAGPEDLDAAWQAGKYDYVAKRLNERTADGLSGLKKIASALQSQVMSVQDPAERQIAYKNLLGVVEKTMPNGKDILSKVPQDFDEQQSKMFIATVLDAEKTAPEFGVTESNGVTTLYNKRTGKFGESTGTPKPEKPNIIRDAYGRSAAAKVDESGNLIEPDKWVGEKKLGGEDGGLTAYQQAQLGKDERNWKDKLSQRDQEIEAARDLVENFKSQYAGMSAAQLEKIIGLNPEVTKAQLLAKMKLSSESGGASSGKGAKYQEYMDAFKRAEGKPDLQRKITERARKLGVVK